MLIMEKYGANPKKMARIAKKIMEKRVKEIRKGRVIREGYAASTIVKRRAAGLQVTRIDLTGNQAYDRKSWRLLDSWRVEVRGNKAMIVWTRADAARIYEYHTRRFGRLFRKRIND